MSNLMNMLFEAATACRVTVRKSAYWDYLGISLDGGKYWVGIQFSSPDKLWFATYCRINRDTANKLLDGEVSEDSDAWGGYSWQRGVELDSEEVHFYSRSKVSQMQWLETFLRDCIAKARSIETPDQPPMPKEPEEDN
jgi:hypothetical protein